MSLKDEIAIVTGASRGIGKAIALTLGARGATVIGTSTSEAGADKISEYLAAAGVKGKGIALNVTDQKSIDGGLDAVQKAFGVLLFWSITLALRATIC